MGNNYATALIVGAGPGISASFARLLAKNGIKVALAARGAEKLRALADEIGGVVFAADAGDATQVKRLFAEVTAAIGEPDIVLYNASARAAGPFTEIDAAQVEHALRISAFGGFLVAQEAARRFAARDLDNRGVILFTGASASVKGYAQSAAFAMGKFALRGLAQSMARELSPQGIHVAHFVIDGAVRSEARVEPAGRPDSMLDPDAIAQTYWHVVQQPRSAWTWEVELRPFGETF